MLASFINTASKKIYRFKKIRIPVIVFIIGNIIAYTNFYLFRYQESTKLYLENLQQINIVRNQIHTNISNHFHLITFINKFIEEYENVSAHDIKKILRVYRYRKKFMGLEYLAFFKDGKQIWETHIQGAKLTSKQQSLIKELAYKNSKIGKIIPLDTNNGTIAAVYPLKSGPDHNGTLVTIFNLYKLVQENNKKDQVSVEIDIEDSKNNYKNVLDYPNLKDDEYYAYDIYKALGKKFIFRFFITHEEKKSLSYWTLAFGVLIVSLVSLLIHSITKTKNIAKNIAEKITWQLRVNEERLRDAQAMAHVGNLDILYKTNEIIWSDEVFNIFGIKPPVPSPENLLELVDSADRKKVRFIFNAKNIEKNSFDLEFRILRNQEIRWVRTKLHAIRDNNNDVVGMKGVILDITDYKKIEEKIENFAFKDHLTGLHNRASIEEIMTRVMNNPDTVWPVCIIFVDINQFKVVNDSFGHTIGDILIKIISDRLMGLKKSGDYLARLTGDEFIFFLTQVHSVENTKYFAERILSTVKKPVEIEGHQFHVASSIGIAFAESNIGAYELLRNADLAKVNAKEQDRNNIQFYIKEMSEVATNKLLLAERIRRGIQQDEFVTFYQLQVELSTMKVIGAEALIRWNHPERGIVSAVEFVEVAETQGLIGEIGEITLEKACSDAVKWRMEGHQISLAVNISAEQFSTKSLVEKVTNVLSSKNLPAHALEIEITESAAMKNPEDATELINELKAIGVSIAIDDFGTGYSSLAYLKRFDIDFIKIDKSFIKDLPNNIEDATIARAICTLGHSLNLRVIAEGVESMDQVNLLRSWKVDEIQGYIISKPIPYDEFILLLKEDFLPDGTWKKFTPT